MALTLIAIGDPCHGATSNFSCYYGIVVGHISWDCLEKPDKITHYLVRYLAFPDQDPPRKAYRMDDVESVKPGLDGHELTDFLIVEHVEMVGF